MKIEKDKYIHAGVSAVIAIVVGLIEMLLGASTAICSVTSFLSSMLVGVTKEWADHVYIKNWSWPDLLADLIGAVTGTLIVLLLCL